MTEHHDPLGDVMLERAAQDRKWGEQNHPDLRWLAILVEEVGELAQALIDGRPADARRELVQVTAVGLAWLEAMERRAEQEGP
jgi:NTP pyrophosphatase (non-canonical NTP hydrolase)